MSDAIDILLVRKDQVEGLDSIVADFFRDKNVSFESQTMFELTEHRYNPRVVVVESPNGVSLQTKLMLRGVRDKYPSSGLVLISQERVDESAFEELRAEVQIDAVLPSSSSPAEVESCFGRIHAKYFSQQKSAVILAEKNGRQLADVLEDLGYQVHLKEGDFKPSEIGEYAAYKVKPELVIIDGKYIAALSAQARSNFPEAFMIAIGKDSERELAFKNGIGLAFTRDDVLKRDALRSFIRSYRKPPRIESVSQAVGKCYILAGPVCSGKTTAGEFLSRVDNTMVFVQKHTTRQPRPGEVEGLDFQFMQKDSMAAIARQGGYFFTFDFSGNKYGIPLVLESTLKGGYDTCVTLTTPSCLGELIARLNEIKPGTAVPIHFDASAQTLKARLMKREAPIEEKIRRAQKIEERCLEFGEARSQFKYAINTEYAGEAEVGCILKAITEWERSGRKDYVNAVLERVLPANFMRAALSNSRIQLRIPPEVLEDYAGAHKVSFQHISEIANRNVLVTSWAYGRVGVFLESFKQDEDEERGHFLNVLEQAVGLTPRARSDHMYATDISIFAKAYCPTARLSDGLLYMLGDDIREHAPGGDGNYAVTFGFARLKGRRRKNLAQGFPLRDQEISFYDDFRTRLFKFPLR